jgi:hypothetical protein
MAYCYPEAKFAKKVSGGGSLLNVSVFIRRVALFITVPAIDNVFSSV